MEDGFVKTWPAHILRLEGASIFAASIWAYTRTGLSWWTFAAALAAPDLSMAGYLANTTVGAALYNAAHTETPGIALLCVGIARKDPRLVGWALGWVAHVNMDRMCGFGLKYGTAFTHSHLGLMGPSHRHESPPGQ